MIVYSKIITTSPRPNCTVGPVRKSMISTTSMSRRTMSLLNGKRSFSGSPVTIRLYRLLQRSVSKFEKRENDAILLQRPIDEKDWGRHTMFRMPSLPTNVNEILQLFASWNDELNEWYLDVSKNAKIPTRMSGSCWTTTANLQEAIRNAFRAEYGLKSNILTKIAILATAQISQQQTMHRLSSVETTKNVRVIATSRFIGMSNPSSHFPPAIVPVAVRSKYRFAYRIRIENLSRHQSVQLLGRYWEIREDHIHFNDTTDSQIIVDAPETGAVGQLPVLRPNQVFEYTSGVDLGTSSGSMKGHFYMAEVADDSVYLNSGDDLDNIQQSQKFEAVVAPFPLCKD